MPIQLYDTSASRQPVSLDVNHDLVEQVRAEGLNLSLMAEEAFAAGLRRRAREKLDAEIAQGLRAHEEYIAECGPFGDAVYESGYAPE